jgi:glycosyltransferase involved in cell wall biosynthesis
MESAGSVSSRGALDRVSWNRQEAQRAVCLLTPSAIPGKSANAIQSTAMARAFAECGYRVTLACQRGTATREEERQSLADLEGAGVQVHYLPGRGNGPAAGYVWAYRLFGEVYRLNVRLIHSRCLIQGVLLALAGRRVTCEVHQLDLEKELKVLLWGQGLRGVRGIVAVSRGLADALKNRGARAEKLVVLHDAVDSARFNGTHARFRSRSVGPDADFTLGYFGSIAPGRGLETLFDAVAATPWLRLRLAGRVTADKEMDGVVQRARESLGSRLEWLGSVAHSRIPELMQSCDALAIPYTRDLRTAGVMSPLKLFEYMAAGRPVVSSQIGTLSEILEDGVNCVSFEPGDPASLVQALTRLRCSETLRNRVSIAAQSTAREYTWKRRARRILDLLESA